MEKYLKSKYEWTKTLARVRMGLNQLIYRPYYNLIWLIIIAGFWWAWGYREQLVFSLPLPVSLHRIVMQTVSALLLFLLILLLMVFLRELGERVSRRDESCLVIAFNGNDLRHGIPVLLSRKVVKGSNVLVREFHSNISMGRWMERKEELEDAFNGRLVKPFIEYGGKKRNNGKRIVVYMVPGRKALDRGSMYEREF